jgi:DNA mismatch repair protein MutS
MNDEYIAIFKKYKEIYGARTAVFLQVGKFFEFYDILDPITGIGQTTTKKIIDFLGIKPIYKKTQDRDSISAGVPTQSVHTFATRLTRENWTCVLFEESKDAKGKITRGVTRILSPGTHIESAENESMFLGALWLEEEAWKSNLPPRFSASVIDLTTGETSSYAGQGIGNASLWAVDDLLHFFQVHPPRELIVFWKGDALSIPQESTIRGRLSLLTTMIHVKHAPSFTMIQREDILRRIFKPRSLLPIREWLSLQSEILENSLTVLVRFVEEHFPSLTETLHMHKIWLPSERVFLGNNVLDQVNFLGAREEESILGMFMDTHTLMGRRAMRKRLLYPICKIETVQARLAEVTAIRVLEKATRQQLHQSMQSISDLPRLHRKIQTYRVSAADVIALEESYIRTLKMAVFLKGTCLEISASRMQLLEAYIADFKKHFDLSKASCADEDSYFLPEARAPDTVACEIELATLKQEVYTIVKTIETWAALPKESLKIESRETLLYAITGTKSNVRQINERLKTDKSQHPYPGMTTTEKKSGANVNVPKLDTIHYAVANKREELDRAFQRELPPICQSLLDTYMETWEFLETWVGNLDVSLTLERVATERGFSCPELQDGEVSSVSVENLRHPLIEAQTTRSEYVKHSITLGDGNSWLVYGMNASGKSSMMKALGISILLAQCGSYVPASKMVLVPFTRIFTRILNHDNIWAGLSSFAVEMSELREILKHADRKSLVLGDEVCSGTESTSATSLVAAAIQTLTERGATFLFATHLHGLLKLRAIQENTKLAVKHLRVSYDPVTGVLIYDRSIRDGAGSTMYGIEVARALNLPLSFIELSQQFRHELLGSVADEDALPTNYNKELRRSTCEVCRCELVREIEIHHIRPQADASLEGKFEDGTDMNHLRNLVPVCQKCHDDHHAKKKEIGPVRMTSDGPVRVIVAQVEVDTAPVQKSKWTSEQQGKILALLREKPNATATRLKFELEEFYDIRISLQVLSRIRKTGMF